MNGLGPFYKNRMSTAHHKKIIPETDDRINSILEVVMSYSRLDFSKKTEITGEDTIDAIGAGINMLGEELENSTVSLKEKEQLLKEIHHRVKNNLQIISSLLNLQSENVLDEKYLSMIRESKNRIYSMALVHEMLYTSPYLSKIELKEYIKRLCKNVHESFHSPGSIIDFKYDVEQELFLDIDKMIPVGLIVNEIVSNSLKYAFPNKKGTIYIDLKHSGNANYLLVSDDGIGLPDKFNPETDGHLGMQLIQMLSEQIGGKPERIKKDKGIGYKIVFQN